MTELQHVSNAIAHWRERALAAEAEIAALKEQHIKDIGALMVAAADDIEDEREACAQVAQEYEDMNAQAFFDKYGTEDLPEAIRRRGENRG